MASTKQNKLYLCRQKNLEVTLIKKILKYNNTYIICVGFKGNAPFEDAEILINEIVKGIQNKNNPTQIIKPSQDSKPVTVAKSHYPKEIKTQKNNLLMEKSRSAQVISQSPNTDELEKGTVLYSKAINTASPFGKELYKEHTYLANQSISEIHSLSNNFHQARTLNKRFYQNIGEYIWDYNNERPHSSLGDATLLKYTSEGIPITK